MRRKDCAVLSKEESSTFFRLFIPLLSAVNQAYEISDDLDEQLRAGRPSMTELGKVARELWEDTDILDEYIAQYSEQVGLPDDDRRILEGWKHPVTATFVLERHLSRGSVFIDPETEKVYLVKGLTQTWEELIPGLKPPFLIRAALLPFPSCIISDGLVSPSRVSFGPGYRESFKQLYLNAKKNGTILTTFETEPRKGRQRLGE